VIFNFPMHRLDPKEFDAPADFPSIWLQRRAPRPRSHGLHWDGNNTDMTERNKSAAFGTGTTPPTSTCRASSGWRSGSSTPSRRPSKLFPIDQTSPPGAPIYKQYCAACHGASGGTSAASTWAA
jgi:hypothetical protein